MPVACANCQGYTCYLCQGMTKTGKLCYYSAREPKDGCPDQILDICRISESVNGVVSLLRRETIRNRLLRQTDRFDGALPGGNKGHGVGFRHQVAQPPLPVLFELGAILQHPFDR